MTWIPYLFVGKAIITPCNEKRIAVKRRIESGSCPGLDQIDTGILFGNLLDNAIEAAENNVTKHVPLTVQIKGAYLSILVIIKAASRLHLFWWVRTLFGVLLRQLLFDFLFCLLCKCDHRAVKELAILADILAGVERKSQGGRIGFRFAQGLSCHTRWSDSRPHPPVFRQTGRPPLPAPRP